MSIDYSCNWPLGLEPQISLPLPERMSALAIDREHYGQPVEVLHLQDVAAPRLHAEDAGRVLISILASGPNFNTNFAALGLPVPVFGRGDSATLHIPGSDALGIVVDAGPAVRSVRAGQAVILDSWTGHNIRGYETHDGFNAQFAVVDEARAVPIPEDLLHHTPEQLAALLLTYGTAYRCVVERLDVRPGDTVLLMGGGKGTSFAGVQIAKLLGARVLVMGSNPELGRLLIERGIADAFVDRRSLPAAAFGVLSPGADLDRWRVETEPFRQAIYAANGGRPVDKIFEHTGGRNFPLLVSALAEGGVLAFFGATGSGLKGEYKNTFFYDGHRCVLDARWVWMRQKQVIFRSAGAAEILSEMRLPPGRKALIWGADEYGQEFARAALDRGAKVAVIASYRDEAGGVVALTGLGVRPAHIIDLDQFNLPADMPDPLTAEGRPNPEYGPGFMDSARALGRAIWSVFGPRVSPDFVVDRPDGSRLHFSTFLARDYDEADEMPSSCVIVRGRSSFSIRGSHMYRSSQGREVVRLLAEGRIVMEQEDLEVVGLAALPETQQKMLEGRMTRPKGVALVQASRPGRTVAAYEAAYLGDRLDDGRGPLKLYWSDRIGIVAIYRPEALNALSDELLVRLEAVIGEVERAGTVGGRRVDALVLTGTGRAFMAGADVTGFVGKTAGQIAAIASRVLSVYARLENLAIPVVSLIDGFALGGGNELAMSTHYRIVTENARLGQPEIKLSMIPGYGGMQRLPRLVGPRRAAALALNGEPVEGRAALDMGLADDFCPSSTALRAAFQAAQELAWGARTFVRRDWDSLAREQSAEMAALFAEPAIVELLAMPDPAPDQRGDLAVARRYAGRIALEALRTGYEQGFAAGLANDARLFGLVTAAPTGQEWVGRFLAKDPRQSAFMTLLL